jgi:large subunit ribosomal protein L2
MKLSTTKTTKFLQKNLLQINTERLRKKPLLKKNIKGLQNLAGRNNSGKITVRHKGGGHKRKYRAINFYRTNITTGITCSLEYDPNRNSYIAAIYDFSNSKFFYILAPKNLKIGDIVESGSTAEPRLGNSLPITQIPVGSYIHNISAKESKPAQISRSAGTFSKLKKKTLNYAIIELSSGEHKLLSPKCFATIGSVSNELIFLTQLKKAGQSRWLNKRPTVRGVAMNPVDHPHGGGEGKKSGKNKTPWGKPNRKKHTNKLNKNNGKIKMERSLY